ncbi:MAG: type II secretion system protein [Burkholderiales bacterium]|nr:type II secretion system protein [Burkholderiales bacterium]
MKSCRGFTLIELLVTLAVVAVLALFTAQVAEVAVQRASEAELRRALREIRDAIDAYKTAGDEGRITRTLQSSGYPKTLALLVDGVEDAKDPKKAKIYFLRHIPRNPLDTSQAEDAADTWGKRAYSSEPSDPHEGDDVYDVFAPSDAIGLNGVAYRKW